MVVALHRRQRDFHNISFSILFGDGNREPGVGDEVLGRGGRVVVEGLRGSPVHVHLETVRLVGREGSDPLAQPGGEMKSESDHQSPPNWYNNKAIPLTRNQRAVSPHG